MARETLTCRQKPWALLGSPGSAHPGCKRFPPPGLSPMRPGSRLSVHFSGICKKKKCLCWKNTLNILQVPAALTMHLVQGG